MTTGRFCKECPSKNINQDICYKGKSHKKCPKYKGLIKELRAAHQKMEWKPPLIRK